MKSIKIHKLEHAAILIEHNSQRIAVDPGSMTSIDSCKRLHGVDAVLVTHSHGDHYHAKLLNEISAPVFGPAEVVALAKTAGLVATPLVLNKPTVIAGMKVVPFEANHGPAVTKPVENYSFVIEAGSTRLYITGDMAGIQKELPLGRFDLVVLPVEGGGFVFDGKEAAEFLRKIDHTGMAIPVHADDAPAMREEFVKIAGTFCKALDPQVGEVIEL